MNTASIDQDFDDMLRRVRTEFERIGEIHPAFECVTDSETFHVPANWPDRHAEGAAYTALRDSFRRRGVNRYVFACEAWVGKTPGLPPADDPERGECVHVIAVERNGFRRYAWAEITRNEGAARIGPWNVNGDVPQSWLLELLEEGYSDRTPTAVSTSGKTVSPSEFHDLVDQHLPEQAADLRHRFEIHAHLKDLMKQLLNDGGDPIAMYMALESVMRSIATEIRLQSVGECAHVLREHPDKFPMFPTVPQQVPSGQKVHVCTEALQHFSSDQRKAGHTPSAMFGAFMNMYMCVGSQAIGALHLADRIENWNPGTPSQIIVPEESLKSMDRIQQDDALKDIADQTILYRPIIIVEAIEGDQQQYRLHLTELDPMLKEPRLFGILVSDLIDHIAGAYHQVSGRDVRDIRRDIVKTLRDEDRFKENDPSRVRNHGIIITPRGN